MILNQSMRGWRLSIVNDKVRSWLFYVVHVVLWVLLCSGASRVTVVPPTSPMHRLLITMPTASGCPQRMWVSIAMCDYVWLDEINRNKFYACQFTDWSCLCWYCSGYDATASFSVSVFESIMLIFFPIRRLFACLDFVSKCFFCFLFRKLTPRMHLVFISLTTWQRCYTNEGRWQTSRWGDDLFLVVIVVRCWVCLCLDKAEDGE